MTSKTHRSSHSSHRSSKSKPSSLPKENKASSTKVNGYQTPNSSQAHSSKTHFSNTSSHAARCTTDSRATSQTTSTQSTNPLSHVHSSHSTETLLYYPGYADYEAAITNGTASLGIEVPGQLQQDLLNRYGQYRSWSVAGEVPADYGAQAMWFDVSSGFDVPYQQVVGYEYEYGPLREALVGIGAQYESV